MSDLFKLLLTLAVILLLLRRRWNVGYVLLASAGVVCILYLVPPKGLFDILRRTITNEITYKLLIALTSIRAFELILRQRKVLEGMMDAMKGLLKNKRAVIVSMPLLIGMLPSVGGAYFSAPMVDEATKGLQMSPEEKAFANYWYRHPWEFVLPLYPGIILASAITSIELRTFILINLPYALLMFFSGFLFLGNAKGRFMSKKRDSRKGLFNFLPILLLLCLVMVTHIELHYALLLMVILMLLYYRYSLKDTLRVIRHGLSKDVIVLIVGVMLFKETLEVSGAVGRLSQFFTENQIPLLPVVFFLPFLTGVLTGITVGFVGSTFPLILSLTGPVASYFTFAFASGFVGVLLSPVHVCLILTREYFKADMLGVYRRMFPLCIGILIIALAEFFLLG